MILVYMYVSWFHLECQKNKLTANNVASKFTTKHIHVYIMYYTYYVLHPATKNQKTYYRGKLKLLLRIIIIARTASNFAFPRSNRKPNQKKKGKTKFIESIFVITCASTYFALAH